MDPHIKCCYLQAINYKKYSTASDVWSFGAVMYEIWSVGCRPFKGHDSQKVYNNPTLTLHASLAAILSQTLELVESGFRLPPPSGCPKEVYKLMIKCWYTHNLSALQSSYASQYSS